jgi:polyhydroxybutyrate depolymerase
LSGAVVAEHRIFAVVLIMLALAGCAAAPGSIRMVSSGETRSYLLRAADRRAAPQPLVIALHGWLGTPAQMQFMSGLSSAASRLGIAVVYPKGDWRAWGIDESSRRGAEDAAFLAHVVDDVALRVRIDRARIFAVGFSNGGFMAQALACSGRLHLAGVAVVASGLAASARAACRPDGPTPFLLIQGTGDPIVPVNGAGAGADRIVSSDATLAFWGRMNQCDGFKKAAAVSTEPGVAVMHETGLHCRGAATEAWFIQGAGHGWPGSDFSYPAFIAGRQTHAIDATSIILAFFLRAIDSPANGAGS